MFSFQAKSNTAGQLLVCKFLLAVLSPTVSQHECSCKTQVCTKTHKRAGRLDPSLVSNDVLDAYVAEVVASTMSVAIQLIDWCNISEHSARQRYPNCSRCLAVRVWSPRFSCQGSANVPRLVQPAEFRTAGSPSRTCSAGPHLHTPHMPSNLCW